MKANLRKKAAERFLSPWLFLIWGLIGVAIVAGVLLFFSLKIDIREEEAKILVNRLTDCISENGKLKEEVLKKDFDIFRECGLSKKILKYSGNYYFNLSISKAKKKIYNFETGVKNFAIGCLLQKTSKGDFPKCYSKRFYLLNNKGEWLRIDVLGASKQVGSIL